jgi:isopenicillin-N N-acyltransferase-like protein
VGLVVNTLSADRACAGIPWIFRARRILESRSLALARECLLAGPGGHSMNFLLAHGDGRAVDVETSCAETHTIDPEQPFMAHTNHYLQPCLGFTDKRLQDDNPSSHKRLQRILDMLGRARGAVDVPVLQTILKDHSDFPFSVCVHGSDEMSLKSNTFKTCLSVVMDLTHNRVFYTLGNPCRNPVEEIDLNLFFHAKEDHGPR